MSQEEDEIIEEGNLRRRIEKLEEQAELLQDSIETLELHDFQKQMDRLNERVKSLEEGLLIARRVNAVTAITGCGNAVLEFLRRQEGTLNLGEVLSD